MNQIGSIIAKSAIPVSKNSQTLTKKSPCFTLENPPLFGIGKKSVSLRMQIWRHQFSLQNLWVAAVFINCVNYPLISNLLIETWSSSLHYPSVYCLAATCYSYVGIVTLDLCWARLFAWQTYQIELSRSRDPGGSTSTQKSRKSWR